MGETVNYVNACVLANERGIVIEETKSERLENFANLISVEIKTKKWGVLGTAGITTRDDTIGAVHSIKGKVQWQSSKRATIYPVQTVDEHCMVIRKSSGLRFDHVAFNGFHFYGPDICLNALSKGFTNYGILCTLSHASNS